MICLIHTAFSFTDGSGTILVKNESVVFLKVGQGDAILIILPNLTTTMLIDGGGLMKPGEGCYPKTNEKGINH